RDRLGYEELNGTRRLNPMTQKWVHPEYHMQVEIWMFNLTNHAEKLVDFVQQGGYPAKFAIEALLVYLKRESPFIDVSVREALYDGYQDPLLGKQNNTDDGLYEVSTGLNDVFNIGKVFTFNNMSVMPETVWDSADAREIRGTDGQLFSPLLEEGKELEIFAAGCLPKGLLDIGRCLPGTPRIYISNPHFFGAAPEVISSIQGMKKPNEEDDQTYVDIEPISGVPIFARRVTQINVGMLKGNLKHLVYIFGVTILTVGLLMWFAVVAVVVVRTVVKPRDDEEQAILQEDVVEEEVGDI
ncbi:CD36 family protein, partial [Teladorsagia circumcincta]